jgi:hypothetical protein
VPTPPAAIGADWGGWVAPELPRRLVMRSISDSRHAANEIRKGLLAEGADRGSVILFLRTDNATSKQNERAPSQHYTSGIKLRGAAADQRALIEDFVEKNERGVYSISSTVCAMAVASCFVLQFVMPLVIVWSYSKQRQ